MTMQRYKLFYHAEDCEGNGPFGDAVNHTVQSANTPWEAFFTAFCREHNEGLVKRDGFPSAEWTFERAYYEFTSGDNWWFYCLYEDESGNIGQVVTPMSNIRSLKAKIVDIQESLKNLEKLLAPVEKNELGDDTGLKIAVSNLQYLQGFYTSKIEGLEKTIAGLQAYSDKIFAQGKAEYDKYREDLQNAYANAKAKK